MNSVNYAGCIHSDCEHHHSLLPLFQRQFRIRRMGTVPARACCFESRLIALGRMALSAAATVGALAMALGQRHYLWSARKIESRGDFRGDDYYCGGWRLLLIGRVLILLHRFELAARQSVPERRKLASSRGVSGFDVRIRWFRARQTDD